MNFQFHILAPNTEEAPPRRSPRKNAYEVLQSKNAGGSDGNKKASKKVVKKRPQVAQKSQAKAPTVKQTLVYETVGPDKVVKTAVKRTHEEQRWEYVMSRKHKWGFLTMVWYD